VINRSRYSFAEKLSKIIAIDRRDELTFEKIGGLTSIVVMMKKRRKKGRGIASGSRF